MSKELEGPWFEQRIVRTTLEGGVEAVLPILEGLDGENLVALILHLDEEFERWSNVSPKEKLDQAPRLNCLMRLMEEIVGLALAKDYQVPDVLVDNLERHMAGFRAFIHGIRGHEGDLRFKEDAKQMVSAALVRGHFISQTKELLSEVHLPQLSLFLDVLEEEVEAVEIKNEEGLMKAREALVSFKAILMGRGEDVLSSRVDLILEALDTRLSFRAKIRGWLGFDRPKRGA